MKTLKRTSFFRPKIGCHRKDRKRMPRRHPIAKKAREPSRDVLEERHSRLPLLK
jgi:hypothetical protein